MIVMPANNSGAVFRDLFQRFPNNLGWLISPGGLRQPPDGLRVACDNAKFASWIKGTLWCGLRFTMFLNAVRAKGIAPSWVVVPDAPGDKEGTLRGWDEWAERLKDEYGWPLAFAVQDGMEPSDVPDSAEIVFVGGTTDWKWKSLRMWCGHFPRVHCARVNTRRQLLFAHGCGAESCDGTGWFRGDQAQLAGLVRFLHEVTRTTPKTDSNFTLFSDL